MRQLKNKIIICFLALFCFSCKKEIKSSRTKNVITESIKLPTELLKIPFVNDTSIISKNGTRYYLNKDDFKPFERDTIQVKIYEFFTKKDLIENNIRTLTNKGDLLDSKGVLKLNLQSGTSILELKEGKAIRVELKKDNYLKYDIYSCEIDNIKQINWKKPTPIFIKVGYPDPNDYNYLYLIKETTIDSLEFYNKLKDSIYKKSNITEIEKTELETVAFLTMSNNTWINIDKLIETPLKKDFNFKCNQKNNYEDFMVYVIYENLNSFISHYITNENLKIKKIPVIGNAKGVIVTYVENKVLYDEFIVNENTNGDIDFNLKEIELEEFKEILTSY